MLMCLPLALLLTPTGACGPEDRVTAGDPPVPCSISGLSTGPRTSWTIGVDPPAQLRWDHAGSAAAVRIDLLRDGQAVATISDSTANDGYYNWMPDLHGQVGGDGFGLRISALGEPACAGEIEGLTLLEVGACLLDWTVDLPENVLAGDRLELTWSGVTADGIVTLELWQDDLGGPPEYVGTISESTPDDGAFTWYPVDSFNYGDNDWYTLRILDPALPDCDDFTGTFRMRDDTICTCGVFGFPAGAVLPKGQAIDLYPYDLNGSRRVCLRLFAGAEAVPGGVIACDIPVDQAYRWVVDDFGYTGTIRNAFRIRTTDMVDGYCIGISDRFTIP